VVFAIIFHEPRQAILCSIVLMPSGSPAADAVSKPPAE